MTCYQDRLCLNECGWERYGEDYPTMYAALRARSLPECTDNVTMREQYAKAADTIMLIMMQMMRQHVMEARNEP